MSYQPGDKVTYQGEKAVVTTVHDDGDVNIVHGTDYSPQSTGPWPVDGVNNVDADALSGGWDVDDGGEATDDDDTPTPEPDEPAPFVAPDGFDAADFVDRTPVSDVADDIADGYVDDHLQLVADAEADGRDRTTVADAIADRREEIEG